MNLPAQQLHSSQRRGGISFLGNAISFFGLRRDVALGDLQSDHAEVQRQEWPVGQRISLCLPR